MQHVTHYHILKKLHKEQNGGILLMVTLVNSNIVPKSHCVMYNRIDVLRFVIHIIHAFLSFPSLLQPHRYIWYKGNEYG